MVARKDTRRSAPIEAVIDSILGTRDGKARWRYIEAYPVEGVERRAAAQSRTTPTDMRAVKAIAEKVKIGEPMPPVVLWETPDNGTVLIDGNHRTLAHGRAKLPTIPAYIVQVDDEHEALILSAAFNAGNGRPLTPSEIRRAVLEALDLGLTDKKIVALFGFSASAVANIMHEKRAEERAERMGLSVDGLSKSHLRTLDRLPMDGPFREATRLAGQSGMSVSDLNSLVKDMNTMSSESAQIERVQGERQARTDDIQAAQIGRRAQGSPYSDLRTITATVQRLREQYPASNNWVAKDAATIDAWADQIAEVAAFLGDVAAEYAARRPMAI